MPMTQITLRCQVSVGAALGLHLRPASLFAEKARQFAAEVRVRVNDLEADGKNVIELLCLAAVVGTVVDLEVYGHDAAEAIEALAPMLATRFECAQSLAKGPHWTDAGFEDVG